MINPIIQRAATLPLLPEMELVELIKKAQQGDKKARDKVIKHNMRFVIGAAFRWRRHNVEMEDVIAEGLAGLNTAIDKFSTEHGVKFLSYATHWVRAKMSGHVVNMVSLVKVGTTQDQRRLVFQDLSKDSDDPKEQKLIEEMRLRRMRVFSLNQRVKASDGENETEWQDFLPSPVTPQDEAYGDAEELERDKWRIESALLQLDDVERFIIKHRTLCNPEDVLQLSEIGKRLGCSRQWASQIEANAMNTLRVILTGEGQIKRKNRNRGQGKMDYTNPQIGVAPEGGEPHATSGDASAEVPASAPDVGQPNEAAQNTAPDATPVLETSPEAGEAIPELQPVTRAPGAVRACYARSGKRRGIQCEGVVRPTMHMSYPGGRPQLLCVCNKHSETMGVPQFDIAAYIVDFHITEDTDFKWVLTDVVNHIVEQTIPRGLHEAVQEVLIDAAREIVGTKSSAA